MAQRLNELKEQGLVTSSEKFNVKFLRESCKKYAQNKLQDDSSWLKKALSRETEDIAGYIPRIEFTARDIESANPIEVLGLKNAIWGRTEIEGKIICEEYKVKIKVIELRDQQIEGLHVTTDEIGAGDSVVYIVNYRNHFVPLLDNIEKNIEESEKVSIEEVYGIDGKVYTKGKFQTEGIGNIIRQEDQQLFHSGNRQLKVSVNSPVFYYDKFNKCDLESGGRSLKKKFDEIIKDLEENKLTHQGSIKLISSKGGIKYLRAKLSDEGRLLFTNTKHNNKDVFVILEVIPNHDYENSRFLKSTDKTKSIEIKETEEGIIEKSSDNVHNVEIKDLQRAHWLGKLLTFSATQEGIVKDVENYKLPLVISGAAGSGKTSVALESLKKMQEKFEGGKILYITKSKNLVKESKKLLEYECYGKTADEFKIVAPEKIEFLSLHGFLEKRTEDIKGKKPIDRNKFFSWFDKICKQDKFKEYKKDGDKIFEELIAVIGGRGLLGKEGKVQYVDLGDRQSIFPKDERCSIYDFFEEYKKFIEGSSEYYDTSLIAYECIKEVQKVYDAVVVDEVQDLTESTLSLVLRSLKDESKGNFLLCGDVNQVIHPSFFSLSKLKSFLSQNKYIRQGSEVFYTLEKSYRNSEQVTEVGNRILHLKNYCFAPEDRITEEEKKLFFMESDTENRGNVCFVTKDKEQEMAGKVPGSINWAVLVLDDESKEEARKLFSTPLVFNIHEAKGLEFENVILYKFMSCKAYNGIWNIIKDKKKIEDPIGKIRDSYDNKEVNTSRNKNKEDKSSEEYKFHINALYVGVTRSASNLYIIDDKSNLLKIIEPKEKGNVNIKKEESSPEEWRDMALKLIDEGNVEQAKDIAIKKLLDKKEYVEKIIGALNHQKCNREEVEKYTKEIMDALEAKERHVEVIVTQSPLDKSCSVGDTVVFEKVKKQLEVEKELVVASQDDHIEAPKDEGIDINAKDLKGWTSSQLEREKSVAKSEKKRKDLDQIIKEEKDKIASNLMKSMKSGEFISFKDDMIKEIFIEYCPLELLGKAIINTLESKIEGKHTAFNHNRRDGSLSQEEITSELADILSKKKHLANGKKIVDSTRRFMEGMFIVSTELLNQKQISRDTKYRLQQLEKKSIDLVRNIEKNITEQFKKLVDNYSEEELDSILSEICRGLENNKAKLEEWINQEEQKYKQEYEQKDDRMMGKKMQNMLKKSNIDLLSCFAPKDVVDYIVQVVECLPEGNLMKIRVGKMVCEHENLKERCQSFLSEKFSLSQFYKLKDEVVGVTDRFFKLCNTFHLLSTEDLLVYLLSTEDLLEGNDLDSLEILEEGSEAHSEETSRSNSNLSGVSVSGHSIQVRGECSKQK
ncbi:hypothetical protein JTE90_005905 [Oedothorax gibbosus]|uniref:UvrD-like helicase ATP-binding domain-containing protein n=1 Tax=Oedothorax gibbosus TaxID=931172 RepID=A0AAV6TR31_9ARAC|nr:hypothetical protein JTE90_005905 [Oedothorax gibbosus]